MKTTFPRALLGLGLLAAINCSLWAQESGGDARVGPGLVSIGVAPSISVEARSGGGFLADFGTRLVGSLVRAQLQYANVGGGDIGQIVLGPISGPGVEAFEIFSDACTGQTLAPGENCVIAVDFSPPDAGTFDAQFVITSTSVNSPETVTLTGRGIFDDIFDDRFESKDLPFGHP